MKTFKNKEYERRDAKAQFIYSKDYLCALAPLR